MILIVLTGLKSEDIAKGLLPGAQFDVLYSGFPTLKHIKGKNDEFRQKSEEKVKDLLPGTQCLLSSTQDFLH